jgi:hypothetical protein
LCSAFALIAAATTSRTRAAEFTIDETLSSLSIVVGAYDGPTFVPITSPQVAVPPSNTTSLGGTLSVSGGIGSVGITGGAISFANQPTDMEPLPGGVLPGAAPANYGLLIDLDGIVAGPGAARGITADITLGSQLLLGNTFNVNGAVLGILTGALDVNLQGFTSVVTSVNIGGNSGVNAGGLGTLDVVGLDATMTVPLFVEALFPVEVAPGLVLPLTARFEGQIVATGVIPEPGSIALLGLAGVGLCLAGRRRLRRK